MAKRSYRRMDCPVETCTSLKGGRQRGAVPGIKRHTSMVHGKDVYEKLEAEGAFGALYDGAEAPKPKKAKKPTASSNGSGDLSAQGIDDLRKLARSKGINPAGLRKVELLEALK